MKLARLYQPGNPRFWFLMLLNLLSAAISHVLRSADLPLLIALILAVFALANCVIGVRIALQLMADPEGKRGSRK